MSKGISRERQVMRQEEAAGWVVYRGAGSHGCADLVALKAGELPRLIQVKATAGGAYERFGPAERALLREQAQAAGAEALLCWWPPRRPQRWIPATEWPT